MSCVTSTAHSKGISLRMALALECLEEAKSEEYIKLGLQYGTPQEEGRAFELLGEAERELINRLKLGDWFCIGKDQAGNKGAIHHSKIDGLVVDRFHSRFIDNDGNTIFDNVQVIQHKWSERNTSTDDLFAHAMEEGFKDLLKASTPGVKPGQVSPKKVFCDIAEEILETGAAGPKQHGRRKVILGLVDCDPRRARYPEHKKNTIERYIKEIIDDWETKHPGR
jgi:hypothetical protein